MQRGSVPAALPTNGVTQLLRQCDAKVFKKYSQMKREALVKLNRLANEQHLDQKIDQDVSHDTARVN
jgi:hypothetical protein